MSKLSIVYIVSLALLGVLIALTVFQPVIDRGQYSKVQTEGIIRSEDGWIIQFDIINHEGRAQKYTISFMIDDTPYCEDVLIQDGGKFTYIHHIRRGDETRQMACCTICKEGEETPFEQATYYLK